MKIDSLKLMYRTFQSCRHALEDAAILVGILHTILETVQHEQMFIVSVPTDVLRLLPASVQQEIMLPASEAVLRRSVWSPEQQLLFALIYTGIQELTRLITTDSTHAVRSLGYALHVIPSFLRAPERFDRTDYQFCFRIAAAHWDELSAGMQQALCNVIGQDVATVSQLVQTDGFTIKMWG
jgi:hypothetical protein